MKVSYLDGWDPNVNNPPVADFEADNTIPAIGQTVNFTDLSSDNPTSWSWSFSPTTVTYVGGTNSFSQNPQVQFNAEGSYTVSLIAANAYGSDNETKTNYINVSYYCGASGAFNFMYISNVQIGSINEPSGQDYYADYTYLSTDLSLGQSDVQISVENGNPFGDDDLGIWIDWNQDGDFYDTGENVVCEIDDEGQGTFTFDVPVDATLGSTRIRVRIKYTDANCGDPCGTSTYGEVEDYSVNIILGADPPVAEFEADNLTPGIGETVNFTDQSSNDPTSWAWTFTPSTVTYVGGTSASSQDPQVQFGAAGNYTVELIATNSGGSDTETKSDYIAVIFPPIADFDANNLSPGIGETVNFTDISTNNPTSWAWTFTPSTVTYIGGTNSGSQNPQVEFDAAGYYTVELIATNVSDSDTETKTDYIFVVDVPVADFEADNTTPGIDEAVNFTDLSTNSPDTWMWSFTPSTVTYLGGTNSGSQNPQVEFDAAGYYTVELMVTNISGGDSEIKTDYIYVVAQLIDLDISVFLEGPFNTNFMNTDLIPLLPLSQPFNVDPWYYPGIEGVVSIPGTDIVDWVLVELRDATSASLADGTSAFDWQAAFLRNDGEIVGLDGISVLHFDSSVSDSLYVVVYHRNHLSIMTAFGLEENGGLYSYDFTIAAEKAFGSDAQKFLETGIWGMYGGDGDRSGQIDVEDKAPLWEDEVGTEGYLNSDYNLDKQSDNQDKSDIWEPNEGQSKQVPD